MIAKEALSEEQVTQLVEADIKDHFDIVMAVVMSLRDQISAKGKAFDKAKRSIDEITELLVTNARITLCTVDSLPKQSLFDFVMIDDAHLIQD